jgi:CubicO group peptidase (beta-lactamase class C family)
MLLSGGTLDGRRYLKPETVALMTSDHIGPESGITHTHLYFLSTESRYGLGVAVLTAEPRNRPWPPGEYGWAGVAGTFFFIDPKDDMFVICMMQTHLHRGRIEEEIARLVYEATR